MRKLGNLVTLSGGDEAALLHAARHERSVGPRAVLRESSSLTNTVVVIFEGFACRHIYLANGRRQILDFLVPGDFSDVDLAMYRRADVAMTTLTACRIAQIPGDDLLDLIENRPRIGQALRIDKLVAEARMREWLVSLGCRTALQRTAYLLGEILDRLQAVGLADRDSCEMPITQTDLADAVGLSPVHINRTLQDLRRRGLIELRGKRLTIKDRAHLQRFAAAALDDLMSVADVNVSV